MRDIINLRDLGGYKTIDGRRIPYHTFYRSGSLNRMNEEEIEEFKKLNIKFILDLRTKQESELYPDPIFKDTYYLRHSGVQTKGGEEINFSPAGMRKIGEEGKKQYDVLKNVYYKNIAFENEAIHVLMDAVINYRVPLIFHCASGKDRTGVAAIVLLALLGVDEETIIEDYLYSNVILKDRIEKELEESKELIEKDPEAKKLIIMINGVYEEIGREVIKNIKEKYGNFNNYFLQEYGINEEKLKEIRDYYLV